MKTLLLRLEGPLQSWGYRSRFNDRDTGMEPTKSGVIGLLCCALGQDRSVSPAPLAALQMDVRVERQGTLLVDFHTAGGGDLNGVPQLVYLSKGTKAHTTVLTNRAYLQDAAFLVALSGNPTLLSTLEEALKNPQWMLSLGRKSCPPSQPVFVSRDLYDADAEPETLMKTLPYLLGESSRLTGREKSSETTTVRWVHEVSGTKNGSPRQDIPIEWEQPTNRVFGYRHVVSTLLQVAVAQPQKEAAVG